MRLVEKVHESPAGINAAAEAMAHKITQQRGEIWANAFTYIYIYAYIYIHTHVSYDVYIYIYI